MENNSDNTKTTPAPVKQEQKKTGLGRGLAALLGGDDDSPFVRAPISQTAKTVTPAPAETSAPITPVEEEKGRGSDT